MVTITSVRFDNNNIIVEMSNGKVIGNPINSYPNLSKGTQNQINNYEIKGGGRWIHWQELDEDRSAEGFLSIQENRDYLFDSIPPHPHLPDNKS